jgi:GMP reductase
MDKSYNYSDIILRHDKSIVQSRKDCDISTQFGSFVFATPVTISNMKSIQTREICKLFDQNNWFYVYQRIDGPNDTFSFIEQANSEKWRVVSVSVGIKDIDLELLKKVKDNNLRVDYITIDVALSFTDSIKKNVEFIKKNFPTTFLIVGNGATGEWIDFLYNQGVDCAKVGIGVSKSCRTRQFTGFGSTTVSSLIECVEAANGRIKVLSDGGLTVENGEVWIGDIAKAIALGADFVMSGALFSRCIDSPSVISGYFGNASQKAKNGRQNIEGTTVNVETNGLTIKEMMHLVDDSLRSSCSYAGITHLTELRGAQYQILS